jgi:hypothetical protein
MDAVMSTNEVTLNTVQAFLGAMGTRNLDAIVELFSEQVDWFIPRDWRVFYTNAGNGQSGRFLISYSFDGRGWAHYALSFIGRQLGGLSCTGRIIGSDHLS